MRSAGTTFKRIILFLGDSVLFFGALYLALLLRRSDIFSFEYFLNHLPRFLVIYLFFVVAIFVAGLYDFPQFLLKVKRMRAIGYVMMAYLFISSTFFYLFPSNYTPKVVLLMQGGILFTLLVLWRTFADRLLRIQQKIKTLLLANGTEARELATQLNAHDYSIDVVSHLHTSFFDNTVDPKETLSFLIDSSHIKMIIADLKDEKITSLLPHIYGLTKNNIRLQDLDAMYQYVFRKMSLSSVGYSWFFEHVSLDTRVYEFIKRLVDILISLPVLIVWALIHPWASWMIRSEDGGSVFIKQKRIGRFGKEITIKKYRTMKFSDGGLWLGEKHNTNTVTDIGYFLRKTRIDELPQVLAVLRGDISLVGPRPDMLPFAEKMEKMLPYYMIRYAAKPGLSGWAQTMMHAPPQTIEETTERLQYDLYYVRNRSLFLDLVIILRTIRTVLSREGM